MQPIDFPFMMTYMQMYNLSWGHKYAT